MEYSLRGAANEMLYVSLDYESRYLGKKVISLIAGKFGKSAMAIALSLVMVVYGEEEDTMWYLVGAATVFNFLWLSTSMSLHSLIEASK
jgi:ATP/ADP translocase